jgi:hypothetical protein
MSVTVQKGSSAAIQVTGDVTTGVGRNFRMQLTTPDAVVAKGLTSGAYIAGPAANRTMPALAGNIGGGALSIYSSADSPTGTFVNSSNYTTVGIFEVKPTGEDVVITNAQITFTESAAFAVSGTAGIYDEDGALISDLVACTLNDAAGTNVAFTLSWQAPADTVSKMYVKVLPTSFVAGDANKTIQVGPTAYVAGAGSGIYGTGVNSGQAIGAPAAAFNTSTVTYKHTGSLTFALNGVSTPVNQAALVPSNGNLMAIFNVSATDDESVLITALEVTDTKAETTAAFNTVSLYEMDALGNLTQIASSKPWTFAAGAGNSVGTFTVADINSGAGWLIPAGASNYKMLAVKADVASGATTADTTQFDITAASIAGGTVAATGGSSGLAIPAGNLTAATASLSAAAGTHTLFTAAGGGVLYVSPNASAPSGAVSRSSTATLAIFDLTAKGAAIAFDNNNAGVEAEGSPALLTFYSTTGGVAATNYRIVDATTGIVYATGAAGVAATDTVSFTDVHFAAGSAQLAVAKDATVSIKLQTDITSTANYPQYTNLKFSVPTAVSVDTRADEAVAAVNNPGGLPLYPAGGLASVCPEVQVQ